MKDYLSLANSSTLFIICSIPVLLTVVQAILFLRVSVKEAKNNNISEETIKKVMVNSAIFSILPSLPIIITLAILMPVLGKFIPWLRLSVIGSAMYESMAADITIKAFGLAGLGGEGITISIFASIVWVMSIAILVGPVLNLLVLKSYDKKLTTAKTGGGFLAIASGALFTGMLALMGIPMLFNFENPVGIIVTIIAGICSITLEKIAKSTGKKILSEFAFPLSMVVGMVSAVIFNGMF